MIQTVPQRGAADPSAATKERLLDAAEKLFAKKGFLATSVRDITTEAGCNVAAVNYHFGGKDALYSAMLRRRVAAVREKRLATLNAALGAGLRPTLEQTLRAIADAFLAPVLEDETGPRFLELMSREMVDRRLPATVFLEELFEPTSEAFCALLRRVEPRLDQQSARTCVHLFVGQLGHTMHARRLFESCPARRNKLTPWPRMIDEIVRFSAGGVRAQLEEVPR